MSPAANVAVKVAAAEAGITEAEFIRQALDRATWADRVTAASAAMAALEETSPTEEREAAWRLD